eukprot:COSAG04_NODE_16997_length_482_cov_1.214099_1_plen_48_part_10
MSSDPSAERITNPMAEVSAPPAGGAEERAVDDDTDGLPFPFPMINKLL